MRMYGACVDRAQRNELLGRARALIYALLEPEPFGLVQVEAMMCGTPVVATSIGAIPELVEHGRTGLLTDRTAQLAALVSVDSLDRAAIAAEANRRFSIEKTAIAYEALYARVCSGADQ
jgi:glycosyltransferase involved in cell wall biosynthesis